jgi:hypothetical protein
MFEESSGIPNIFLYEGVQSSTFDFFDLFRREKIACWYPALTVTANIRPFFRIFKEKNKIKAQILLI